MEPWFIVSPDPDETRAAGRALGRSIGADGLVIALVGPLGAGKTVFVKGLAEGLGLDPRAVSSPTFVIAQQYPLPQTPNAGNPETLHHIDLYRLETEDELESIGFFDMLAPGGVLACEWADRFPDVLGRDVLRIELDGPTAQADQTKPARQLSITGSGEIAERVAADWRRRVHEQRAATATGSESADLRLIVWLLISLGLLGLQLAPNSLSSWEEGGCAHLAPVAADLRGTTVAVCAASVGAPLEGVGLLLDRASLDLNRASIEQLVLLPGIGPARAAEIVRTRSDRPFANVREIERVSGIGPATRKRLARFATTASAPRASDFESMEPVARGGGDG